MTSTSSKKPQWLADRELRSCCVSFLSILWNRLANGLFTVKSFYKKLFKYEDDGCIFPCRQMWKPRIPPRVSFSAWEASRECCLTSNKLRKMRKILVNACYFCKRTEESCNHLLLWCPVIYKLWIMFYDLLGISWDMTGSVRDEIWVWRGIRGCKKHVEIIPLSTLWVVWNDRNKRIFDGVKNIDDFEILKNRWFQTLSFFVLGHHLCFMKALTLLIIWLTYRTTPLGGHSTIHSYFLFKKKQYDSQAFHHCKFCLRSKQLVQDPHIPNIEKPSQLMKPTYPLEKTTCN